MVRKRLTMKKIKEIIRLKYEAGLSNRVIASACKISNSTVGEYLKRAGQASISWPLGDMGEEELMQILFPDQETEKVVLKYPMPNWEEVQKEKREKGVTLQLLWQEYKVGYPDGYQYSQYCEHFRRWKKSHLVLSVRIFPKSLCELNGICIRKHYGEEYFSSVLCKTQKGISKHSKRSIPF